MKILNMFDTLFGWRKASKCKKLIRHVQCRLKILKNKRESIIRQIRGDVVELIKKGDDHTAFARVEQLLRDQNIQDLYDQLDNFSELIILRLPYIRKHKDCPRDIHEAVSSLLYASLVCGDLPELKRLRKLFGKRYGNTFVRTELNLLPGNLVNQEVVDSSSSTVMVEKVRQKNISDDVKFRLMKEIARENNLQLRPPDIEMKYHHVGNIPLLTYGIEWEESACKGKGGAQFQTSNDIVDNSFGDLTPTQPSSKDERLCLSNEAELYRDRSSRMSICRSSISRKPDKIIEATSQIFERINVYRDDIEEFRPSGKDDKKGGDQRFFMFNSPTLSPKCGATRRSLDSLYDRKTKECTLSYKSFSTKGGNSKARTGSRVSVEGQGCNSSMSMTSSMKDVEFALYYYGGGGVDFLPNSKSIYRTKHQYKKKSVEKRHSSSCCRKEILSAYPQERNGRVKIGESNLRRHSCECQWKMMYNKDFNQLMACDRCLKCYFSVSCDDTDLGSPPRRSSMTPRFVKPLHRNLEQGEYEDHCNCHNFPTEVEFVPDAVSKLSTCSARTKGENVRGRKPNVGVSFETDKQNEHRKEDEEVNLSDCPVSFASSSTVSFQAQPSPYKSVENLSIIPYKPLQVNQSKGGASSISHVHPKLPDYEDLVSKFTALKIENLQR